MKQSDIPKEILPRIKELPGDLSRLAEIIESVEPDKAVEITLKIAEEFRGTHIYIHNTDKIKRKARDQWIIEQYGLGRRVADLAREACLSSRMIWKILGKEPKL